MLVRSHEQGRWQKNVQRGNGKTKTEKTTKIAQLTGRGDVTLTPKLRRQRLVRFKAF